MTDADLPPTKPLPPRVRREVERILSGVVRRLFLERLDLLDKRRRSGLTPDETSRLADLDQLIEQRQA